MNIRSALLALAACVALSPEVTAADDAPFFDVDRPAPPTPGLAVGARAPAFDLVDQDGRRVSLDSVLGRGPVAVVFFRSADWCAYCKLQLVQLQQHLPEIEAAGAQVVGISFDTPEILHRFAAARISYRLLSDTGSRTIDAFGVRNPEAAEWSEGVARHATFILDRDGTIRAKLFKVSYAQQAAVDELLVALRTASSPPAK